MALGALKPASRKAKTVRTVTIRHAYLCGAAVACLMLGPMPVYAAALDFNGVWGKYTYSYPKPYMKGRKIADGYNNEYLLPWVVDYLKKDDMVSEHGKALPTAHSLCYPEGIPYIFGETRFQVLQTPSEITMIFGGEQEQSRTIYLNREHPQHVTPSWYGDSVGHFEGDTLVVDTVGIAAMPESGSMGLFGTPHTSQLHVVERYRFLKDGEKTVLRGPNPTANNVTISPDEVIANGRKIRLTFTVDDPGAYRKPWSVTLDFLPLKPPIQEYICTENYQDKDLMPLIPKSDIPDF